MTRFRWTFAMVLAVAISVPMTAQAGRTCEPDPGPVFMNNATRCVPTPEECATGLYNGVYDVGLDQGRFGVCLSEGGRILAYGAGDLTIPCGVVFVADRYVIGSYPDHMEDPNTCF